MTSQEDQQQSVEALPVAVDFSKTPDFVSVGVPALPTSSSSAGPLGPTPEDQGRNLPDLSAILADPTTLHWLNQFPRLLWRCMRATFDIQASCPRPLHRWLCNLPLVTSCEKSLRSLRLFQGPFPRSRV